MRYYVTARDAGRTAFLLGPMETLEEAKALVEETRLHAPKLDSRAWFYLYGVTAVTANAYPEGILGGKTIARGERAA